VERRSYQIERTPRKMSHLLVLRARALSPLQLSFIPQRLFSMVARVPLTFDDKGTVIGQYPMLALEKLGLKLQVEGNEARNNRRAVSWSARPASGDRV
jgi:hypothetical protein